MRAIFDWILAAGFSNDSVDGVDHQSKSSPETLGSDTDIWNDVARALGVLNAGLCETLTRLHE